MKITRVNYYPIKPRHNARGGIYWFLIKLETDEGIAGWGEIIWNAYDPDTLGKMVRDVAERYFVGQSPFQIESMFAKMFALHCKFHSDLNSIAILSGFEIACWDIIGKKVGQPVYNLLGGCFNPRIRAYTYLYEKEDRIFCEDFWQMPKECVQRAKECVAMGFTAIKLDPLAPYLDSYATMMPSREVLLRAERTIAGIREAVGPDIDIIIGTHGQFTAAGSIRVAKLLEPYDPLWLEEPTPPEHHEVLKKVSEATTIPIATGERLTTKYEYAPLMAERSCDIYQIDLSGVGGILEAKKIAAMAESFHTLITTHFWAGPVNFAAQLQLAACCPNFLIQEAIDTMGSFAGMDKVLDEPFQWDQGYFVVSKKPGLGLAINEEKVKSLVVAGYDERNVLI